MWLPGQLLDTTNFMPHGMCYMWRPDVLALHVGSDALIAISYFAIPGLLFALSRKRSDLLPRWALHLFSAFILLCGLTHAFAIWTVWTPNYVIQGLLKLATGLVSLTTAVLVSLSFKDILAIPKRDELERLNASLRDQIEERERTEQALRQSQKMEAIGQLTGGVAHDFNNLLTIILGNAQLLERKFATNHEAADAAVTVSSAARRGAELVQHLLAFSRKQTLAPQVVDVSELVLEMRSMLRRTLAEDVEVETIISAGVHPALVDPARLESAVLNLCVNARDAMPNGGVLTIAVDNARARGPGVPTDIELLPDQDYLRISVSDTGTGMPPELIEHIFEPFFTTKDVNEGSGLGLSMVFGFIQQSGGQIHVDSEVGRGTTFQLYLPPAPAEAPEGTDTLVANRQDQNGNETILVVEDEVGVRALAAAVLRDVGYRVLEAKNGHDALGILQQQTDIDLLFTDVVMPGGMNGQELAGIARQRWPALKVLLTTGYSQEIVSRSDAECAGESLIAKPYEEDTLARTVREILDREAIVL